LLELQPLLPQKQSPQPSAAAACFDAPGDGIGSCVGQQNEPARADLAEMQYEESLGDGAPQKHYATVASSAVRQLAAAPT